MANNYTGFSFLVNLQNKAEEAWWEELFKACELLQEAPDVWEEEHEDTTPIVSKLSSILGDFHGDHSSGFGVDIQFEPFKRLPEQPDMIRDVWFHAGYDGCGNSAVAAQLIQWFLQDMNRDDAVVFSWCDYCEKPRLGEFGGGTMRITAKQIRVVSTQDLECDAESGTRLFAD